MERANGGPVGGPGRKDDDRVLRMLAPGEHVWTAREVAEAGGCESVERLRRHLRE